METLSNKIDFAVILIVKNANPNGDPLNGNRPRVNNEDNGEISDVCIKRKLRNRLMEAGKLIFVQSDDNRIDNYGSLQSRALGELNINTDDEDRYRKAACEKWIDVRAFGQVFAYPKEKVKNDKKGKTKSKDREETGNDDDDESEDGNGNKNAVSIGIRGPVSVQNAFSVRPINISSIQITKSVSGVGDGVKRASDTMGMKHRVDHGVYVFYGSINPQLASKTGFSDNDAEDIKQALIKLFQNDASSARPEGSMEVYKVYWWEHNCKNGQYSSAKVHRSLKISLNLDVTDPKDIADYEIKLQELPGLTPEIIDGL